MRGIKYIQAIKLIENTITYARKNNTSALSVVVLDTGGHVKACASEDGVGTLRFEIARGKANAALGMGFDTIQFSQLLQNGILTDAFNTALVGAAKGVFNPNPGGVLIKVNNEILGAIGVSGSTPNNDHNAINYALDIFRGE